MDIYRVIEMFDHIFQTVGILTQKVKKAIETNTKEAQHVENR